MLRPFQKAVEWVQVASEPSTPGRIDRTVEGGTAIGRALGRLFRSAVERAPPTVLRDIGAPNPLAAAEGSAAAAGVDTATGVNIENHLSGRNGNRTEIMTAAGSDHARTAARIA